MSKKKQRKKLPITSSVNTVTPTNAFHNNHKNDKVKFKQSRVETARLIRRFHVLNKELAKCRKQSSTSQREQEILQEMEAMGGLDWYQKASQLGQSKRRGGDSSKWLIQTMKERLPSLLEKIEKPLHVLDVGAVAPDNYKLYKSWIHARAIDLNPQHQDIEQQDFLKMKPPEQKFDILCLSLVINFVGDPRDRGRMLVHSRHFLYTPAQKDRFHYLFLVLPLPCINNSRYMSHQHFLTMMSSIGYTKCVHYHFSSKLAYYLFELTEMPDVGKIEWKKKILPGQEGGSRNNFSIVIG